MHLSLFVYCFGGWDGGGHSVADLDLIKKVFDYNDYEEWYVIFIV